MVVVSCPTETLQDLQQVTRKTTKSRVLQSFERSAFLFAAILHELNSKI